MTPRLLPMNFRKINLDYLITNDAGDYAFLTNKEFHQFVAKKNLPSDLLGKFWINSQKDVTLLVDRYRISKSYLNQSTTLFIMVLTSRCNLSCIYCQTSRKNSSSTNFDMKFNIAQKAIDFILQSPSKEITIEFQGGEPLINFDVLKYIVSELRVKENGRVFRFTLVSNLILLTDEKLDFLIKNKVSICTSLDGNSDIHNNNRPRFGGSSSYDDLIEKIKKVNINYEIQTPPFVINAIQTTTASSLGSYKEIIDEYIKQGFTSIYLRPLSPFGLAKTHKEDLTYSPYDYVRFYKSSLNYILDINNKGYSLIERTAQIFLKRILSHTQDNFVDLRSPCGAVLGQIAINYDGDIYTCDEGRMLAETGDKTFRIGNVAQINYQDIRSNLVTQAVCLASCSECAQRCHQCAYRPYCGVCPVMNYSTERDIFKNSSYRCIINEGILDYIFQLLREGNNNIIFNNWITS